MSLIASVLPPDFREALTPPLKRLYVGFGFATTGMGLTLSFYVVYLHNIRHFPVAFATALLGIGALVGLAAAPMWGSLTDHRGPVPTMVTAIGGTVLCLVAWSFVHTKTQAVAVALPMAFFGGGHWGAGGTLIARLIDERHRPRAYSFNFLIINFGTGTGALISALVVNVHRPSTFHTLYLLNAMCWFIGLCILAPLWPLGRHAPHQGSAISEGWREVLTDRRLVFYAVAFLVMMTAGYGSVEGGLSLYIVDYLHRPAHFIGLLFVVNAVTIVGAQLVVLNAVQGRSRMRLMAVAAGLWTSFWLLLTVAHMVSAAVGAVILCLAMVAFSLGETLMSPVGSSFLNAIAPEHLRGRYNSVSSLVIGASTAIAPTIAGAYFARGLAGWWPLSTALTALVAAGLFVVLRRRLSASDDGRAK